MIGVAASLHARRVTATVLSLIADVERLANP